ncbi:MAG TPA: HAMP domain-containing sensor histidine kinase [Vicinamibacterales bacterium]|nr:HAMP domain-containing sensor histidine kinase [Vicinamibacterales bacterium]
MNDGPADPRWPKLLSLTAHEFRTPLTVVAGYVRMLLTERAGPVSPQQRRLLDEAEKSCARLSALLAELSELSRLEADTAAVSGRVIELRPLLAEALSGLPALPDRDVPVELSTGEGEARVHGDPARLKAALTAVIAAMRRELIGCDRLIVRERVRVQGGSAAAWIAIGDPRRIDALVTADPTALTTFDEWRGGCGLSLVLARHILTAHHGTIWSPVDDRRAGAVISLPLC